MNHENLLNLINQLSTNTASSLCAAKIKQMLIEFQNKCLPQTLSQQVQSRPKTKKIRKFFSKTAFKKYIKRRLPSVVQKSLDRVVLRDFAPVITAHESNIKAERGKSKFKKRTQSRKIPKQLKFLNKFKAGLRISNHEQLACPICLQTMVSPALTLCGHVFCLECIDESLLFSQTCPNCRQNIRFSEPIPCRVLDNLIRSKIFMSQTQRLQFQARIAKFENWRQMRFLDYNKLHVGTLVDVRDTENIWCQGDILKIYRKINKTTGTKTTIALLIHYKRWNKLYNQIIDVPSSRLAPLNCFSGRIDIPRYNLSQADGNLRGSVVSGPTLRIQFASPNPLPLNFHFDLLNQNDEILEISESEEGSSNREEENQAEQNDEQEEQQQNSESISQLAEEEAISPFANGGFQRFWNIFRNRLAQRTVSQHIFPRLQQRSQSAQINLDSAENHSQGQAGQSRQRDRQNSHQVVSDQGQNSNQQIDNVEEWQQLQLTPLRESQLGFQNNDSERKQNQGSQYEMPEGDPDCQ